jgi:uncharacterized protein YjbJ (UPF0337 family)
MMIIKESAMNNDKLEGNWKQLRGEVKRQWGKLTDDDVERVEGNRDKLAGIIQERYGVAKEEAHRQVDEWTDRHAA